MFCYGSCCKLRRPVWAVGSFSLNIGGERLRLTASGHFRGLTQPFHPILRENGYGKKIGTLGCVIPRPGHFLFELWHMESDTEL